MTERIQKLTQLTLEGKMYVTPVKTEFDRMDILLSQTKRDVKRICEYILHFCSYNDRISVRMPVGASIARPL